MDADGVFMNDFVFRVTLSRYLLEKQRENKRLSAELSQLVEIVADACKQIAITVARVGLVDAPGKAGSKNVQGEAQKKPDVISNNILRMERTSGGNGVRRDGLAPTGSRRKLMSRANTIFTPGDRQDLAMQLILTPLIWRLMARRHGVE
jgi:hypothetical protein